MADRDLHITLHDRVGATEVTPDAVPLTLLKQFADEAGRFLIADGRTLFVKASREQLHDEKEYRLYHEVLAHIEVQHNRDTGEWRDARLIRFEDYRPAFDPDAFSAFVEEGGRAWHDVADPVAWVREQRGG